MATFRDLLLSLQNLSSTQLDQEIKIIPIDYCSESPVEIDGCSPFSGKVELGISRGSIIYEECLESPMCGGGFCGCFDLYDSGISEEDMIHFSTDDVVLKPGMPYIKISNDEE